MVSISGNVKLGFKAIWSAVAERVVNHGGGMNQFFIRAHPYYYHPESSNASKKFDEVVGVCFLSP